MITWTVKLTATFTGDTLKQMVESLTEGLERLQETGGIESIDSIEEVVESSDPPVTRSLDPVTTIGNPPFYS